MVTREIGSVKGLLALYREESFNLEELKKDLETYNKELLIEHIVSDLNNGETEDDDF